MNNRTLRSGHRENFSPEQSLFGETLKELRRAHGLAQRDIARLLSISVQQVQKYESGQNRMTVDKLYRLQQYYNIPFEAFFKKFRNTPAHVDSPFFNAYLKFLTLKDRVYRRKIEDILLILLR